VDSISHIEHIGINSKEEKKRDSLLKLRTDIQRLWIGLRSAHCHYDARIPLA